MEKYKTWTWLSAFLVLQGAGLLNSFNENLYFAHVAQINKFTLMFSFLAANIHLFRAPLLLCAVSTSTSTIRINVLHGPVRVCFE